MLARAALEAGEDRPMPLKIFFGAVPGVGKTYAMLEAAHARRRAGTDVVIGWVETHGRPDTAALAEGFERLPPRVIQHRGLELREFDIDAALARRPGILLVDELAHTNVPGSRHSRRWQDVVELVEAGIEVWTTLNVQHVESQNDVVQTITGVAVRETVPDSVIDSAAEIELIDLPPDDLLQRLREGKVYVPAQAERAAANFFRKGNLIALRELALRRTAERVDAQAVSWKVEHGIAAPWTTRERLVVAVDGSPASADLVRAGRRMAARLRAPWTVVHVEDPGLAPRVRPDSEGVQEALALAQRLGAETLVVRGRDLVDEIVRAAEERNATRILIGKPQTSLRWRPFARGSLLDALIRKSGAIEVLVTSGEEAEARRAPRPVASTKTPIGEYGFGFLVLIACTLIGLATRDLFTLADQAMIYLLGVLVASSRVSRVPAFVCAILSIAALDYFFVPPFHTFDVNDVKYAVTFLVMLIVALSVSGRTVRLRELASESNERERRTASLFDMSRGFSAESEPTAVAELAVKHVQTLLGSDAVVFEADDQGGLLRLAGGESSELSSEREMAVARWVLENGRPAGHGTDTLPSSKGLFLPMPGAHGTAGVFGVALEGRADVLSPSQRQLLETYVSQTALALERTVLGQDAARARLLAETERTRNALLSTVSHDLRTPLASITGSAQVLLDRWTAIAPVEREHMLRDIREEGDRLGRLVADLLELTRLQAGQLAIQREWCPVDEVATAASDHVRRAYPHRHVDLELPDFVLMADIDPILVEHALWNLLENACKYSESDTPIELRAHGRPGFVTFEVSDRGRGIPAGDERRIFEEFYRTVHADRIGGSGLGLSIVAAIARAHGGSAEAENRLGGGATFRLHLPVRGAPPPPPPAVMEEARPA